MDTIKRKILPGFLVLLTFFTSVTLQAKTAAELAAEENNKTLYGEIGVGVLFVVALTLFVIWKSKHDKKEREKHLEQMRKVAASKKRAA
jgi:hypothetical protein